MVADIVGVLKARQQASANRMHSRNGIMNGILTAIR